MPHQPPRTQRRQSLQLVAEAAAGAAAAAAANGSNASEIGAEAPAEATRGSGRGRGRGRGSSSAAAASSASTAPASAPADPGATPGDGEEIVFEPVNPKKEGSGAYDRYEKYKSARTVAEALNLGACKGDIAHDFKRGFLKRRREF